MLLPLLLSGSGSRPLPTSPRSLQRLETSTVAVAAAELPIVVREAGDGKGMGAFASAPIADGALVCCYEGELLTLDQTLDRYSSTDPSYLFSLGDGSDLYIDGASSSHPSRYINHHQNGTLAATVSTEERTVIFHAARDIAAGEELTFDYGEGFWVGSNGVPAQGTDDRTFEPLSPTDGRWRPPPGPPPLFAKSAADLDAVDRLDDRAEARLALVRTLEFFGAARLSSGDLAVPSTLSSAEAPRTVLSPTDAPKLREACGKLVAEIER